MFDRRVCTRGRIERRRARRMCAKPADERALRDKFKRDLARQVELLEVLVPAVPECEMSDLTHAGYGSSPMR